MAQALPEGVDRLTFIVGHQQDASKNQVVKGIPGFALNGIATHFAAERVRPWPFARQYAR